MGRKVNVEKGKQGFQKTVPVVVAPKLKAKLKVQQVKKSTPVNSDGGFSADVAFEKVTDLVALEMHEQWRAPRKRDDGTFEERWKPDGNGGMVDIANTPYDKLPNKWKEEGKVAVKGAIMAVQKFAGNIEQASNEIHEQWLERNGEWAEPHQKVPYAELSEEEKEKDRVIARIACKVLGLPTQ